MTIRCPACETELDPGNTHCPVCLRQRSRKEIMQGLQQTKPVRRTRWSLLFLLLLSGGFAYFGVQRKQAHDRAVLAERFAHPPSPPPPQEEARSSGTMVIQTAVARPSPAPPAARGPKQPFALPPAHAQPMPAPSVPDRVPRNRWSVHGQIYDLLALKAVPGVRLVFQDKSSGQAFAATTDARGQYRVSLPKVRDGGYEITVSHKRYNAYLEEMTPTFRHQSLDRRQEAADQLTQAEVLHVPLLPDPAEDEVVNDLVLFQRQ